LTNQLPIQQEDRTIIVDVLRGFALFGVLQGNLAGMLTNNVPQTIIDAHASGFDHFFTQAVCIRLQILIVIMITVFICHAMKLQLC